MALNINGTTGISGVDGSASAPALQGTDSNTGINFASDTVNINTGGVTRATVDSSGNLNIPNDSGKIKLGASGDLQIYHDGNNNKITTSNGSISLESSGESMLDAHQNGAVALYYDNVKKIETSSLGCGINSGAASDTMLGIKHTDGGIEYITCRSQNNTLKMYVHVSGNLYNANGNYSQISDQSLKENIVDAKSQWNDIKNIKIRNLILLKQIRYSTQIGEAQA